MKSNLVEIFSSIQGEGPYIGYKQIFLRFAGCNLNCAYCDTDFNAPELFKVEKSPGSGVFEYYKNPIVVHELEEILSLYAKFNHHSISLTGGEPLLHSEFLEEFLPKVKSSTNLKTYLETNGLLYKQLKPILNYLDIISMDIKLESSTGEPSQLDKHSKFLEIAVDTARHVFVKLVITSEIRDEELLDICKLLSKYKEAVTVVVQPVTTTIDSLKVTSSKLFEIYEKFVEKSYDVRIIPQAHRMLNIL